jgi:hypothetical protein
MWWKKRGGAGIRRVLMDEWDPIGARDIPSAADEYDSYVGRVGRMLHGGASAKEIARYLRDVRIERMGLGPGHGPEEDVAAALVEWYSLEMRTPD